MTIQFNFDDIEIETRQKLYEKLPNGKRQLSIKIHTIIWYCAKMIGVQKITEENYKEVFNRIFEYEEVFGTRAVRWEDIYDNVLRRKVSTPIHYTAELEDIKIMIGMETVCDEELTNEEWKQKFKNIKTQLNNRTKELEESYKESYETKYVDMRKVSEIIPEPNANTIKDILPVNLPDNPNIDNTIEPMIERKVEIHIHFNGKKIDETIKEQSDK